MRLVDDVRCAEVRGVVALGFSPACGGQVCREVAPPGEVRRPVVAQGFSPAYGAKVSLMEGPL